MHMLELYKGIGRRSSQQESIMDMSQSIEYVKQEINSSIATIEKEETLQRKLVRDYFQQSKSLSKIRFRNISNL
jgi:hypothetical protein